MAINTCVVSGVVFSLENSGLNSVRIKASITQPFTHTDGTTILNYEVSTTSDATGNWSLTLIETTLVSPALPIPITISFEYPSGGSGDYLRREYTVVIPNTPTATFASLIGTQ